MALLNVNVYVLCEFIRTRVFVSGLRVRRAPLRARAQRASVRSLHAHTAPPSHTESIETAQVLYSIGHCGLYSCISGTKSGGSMASPFLSLTTVVFSRAFPQSRAAADQSASLFSTPARSTAT
jgi:hypothetical protein